MKPRLVDVAVIGGGHCGLAMSQVVSQRGVNHVVIERGEVANAWRSERWDSLRLLTPNWMCRLPGQAYEGSEPDGFMSAPELAAYLGRYADRINAPLATRTTVQRVTSSEAGYLVATDQGDWQCRAVVLATGACSRPALPGLAASLPASVA